MPYQARSVTPPALPFQSAPPLACWKSVSFTCSGVPFSRLSPRSEPCKKAVAEGDRRLSTSSKPLRCAVPAATSTGPRSSSANWTYPAVVKASPAARALHGPLCPDANTDPTAVFSFPSEASTATAFSSLRLRAWTTPPSAALP